MLNLSVLIIAKNEELHIGNNIRRLKKYLNPQEIIIIDDFSTDATAKIATELGVKVVQHALNGDFGAQRDFAISQATAKWILFLDADEYMTEALGCEIRKALTECDQSDKLFPPFIPSSLLRSPGTPFGNVSRLPHAAHAERWCRQPWSGSRRNQQPISNKRFANDLSY